LAPSGGWPRAGRASKGPPYDPPGPVPRDRKVSRGPVEAEGGIRVSVVKPRTQRTPGTPAPGIPGGIVEGGAAPGPKTRETVGEVSVILTEAEAGKKPGPTPKRGRGPTPGLSERGKG